MRPAILLVTSLISAGLMACSENAPQAPIGLDKRPANSAEAIVSLTARQDDTQPRPVAAQAVQASGPNSFSEQSNMSGAPAGLTVIVVSDFSAPHGVRSISQADRVEILAAAKAAARVTLFCRGDRARTSVPARAALLRRGVQMKRVLVSQGVDPARIRLFVRSAGAFVADNGTAAGRAKNRRVEIHFA